MKYLKDLEISKVLSLFENYCHTNYGRNYINENFKIYEDFSELEKEINVSQSFITLFQNGHDLSLKGLDYISEYVDKAENNLMLEPLDYKKIANFLDKIYHVYNNEKEFFDENINNIFSNFVYHRDFVELIFKTVSPDGEILDTASPKLKDIRKELSKTKMQITSTISNYANRYAKYLSLEKPVTKNGRLCLAVKGEYRTVVHGLVIGKSDSGFSYFIEPEAIIELNEKIVILMEDEKAEISRILSEINLYLIKILNSIKKNIKMASYLDYLIGKTNFAVYNRARYFVPHVKNKRIISFSGLKHPLLPREKVVPLRLSMNKDHHPNIKNGMIITGPNTGGKTVALKSIGIAFALTHAGFPIIADECEIPFIKNIATDMGDEQDISQNLSTFSAHLTNIKDVLANASESTLVLIDELGTGTDPIEGAAIGTAVIKRLLDKNSIIFITSHLSEIKTYSIEEKRLLTASMSFDMETLNPTYILMVGVPGASHAIEIAQKMGFDDELINDAKENMNKEYFKNEQMFSKLSDIYKDIEKAREEQKIETEKLNMLKLDYETKFESVKKKELEKVDKELANTKAQLKAVKSQIEEAIKEVKNMKAKGDHENLKKTLKSLEESSVSLQSVSSEKEEKHFFNAKTGMKVIVPGGQEGIIQQLNGDKALIKLTNQPISLTYDVTALKPVGKPVPGKPETRHEKPDMKMIGAITRRMAFPEIDIRGYTVDEAIPEIEKFISDLMSQDIAEGYIIHGKGTGKLAEGIWAYLRRTRTIKSFRIGKETEGGTGVTVVEV